ncbi:hypothetical protein ADK54_17580 [Streptomyces sp. WM6378]|nr:hypothetical protein ADK54_17580 [Streptomyces sp. WM6378]
MLPGAARGGRPPSPSGARVSYSGARSEPYSNSSSSLSFSFVRNGQISTSGGSFLVHVGEFTGVVQLGVLEQCALALDNADVGLTLKATACRPAAAPMS